MNDNELIATFLGWRLYNNLWHNEKGDADDIYFFESSWDCLMPVIEKIETIGLFRVFIGKQFIRIEDVDPFVMRTTINVAVIGRPKIRATYQAVVEFIKWYNQANEKKD